VAGRESERIAVELQRPVKVVNTDHGVNDLGQFFLPEYADIDKDSSTSADWSP
jgi:hypothetical protein